MKQERQVFSLTLEVLCSGDTLAIWRLAAWVENIIKGRPSPKEIAKETLAYP